MKSTLRVAHSKNVLAPGFQNLFGSAGTGQLGPLNVRLELLGWQIAAWGMAVVWLLKPYLWAGLVMFALAFGLGYYLATAGVF